jgi:hypothetical protein
MAPKKIVTTSAITGTVWLISGALFLLVFIPSLEAPAVFSAAVLALGTVVWVAFGLVNVRRQLKSIEQHGADGVNIKSSSPYAFIWPLVGLAVVITVTLLASYFEFFESFWAFLFIFLVPSISAFGLTSAVFYWRWQRKNKRTLYYAEGKLYPYPYMNMDPSKETILT